MEVRGNKLSFTPHEARWAQHATLRVMPGMSQRIFDAQCQKHTAGEEADGERRINIVVEANLEEKLNLLLLAQNAHAIAKDEVELPQLNAIETEAHARDFSTFAATSDFMDADQAVALADLLDDPEFTEGFENYNYQQHLEKLRLTASVVKALEAHLKHSE